MTEGGKSEIQGEAWVRSLLTLKQPPAALLFMDGKRAQRWASTYKGLPLLVAALFVPIFLKTEHRRQILTYESKSARQARSKKYVS